MEDNIKPKDLVITSYGYGVVSEQVIESNSLP